MDNAFKQLKDILMLSIKYQAILRSSVRRSHPEDLSSTPWQARVITPPHATGNLRRCLSNAENIDNTIITRLFIYCTVTSQSAMDDAGRERPSTRVVNTGVGMFACVDAANPHSEQEMP